MITRQARRRSCRLVLTAERAVAAHDQDVAGPSAVEENWDVGRLRVELAAQQERSRA